MIFRKPIMAAIPSIIALALSVPAVAANPAAQSSGGISADARATANARSAALAQPTQTPSASKSFTKQPPGQFDPSKFGRLTTDTLPMENGQRIVMRVNGRAVSWKDFSIQSRVTGATAMLQHPDQRDGIMAALSAPVMDGLVLQTLYDEFAEKHHLAVQPREIQQRLDRIQKSANASTDQATSLLNTNEIRRLIAASLTREKVDKYLGDEATSEPATAAEISSFTLTMRPTTSPMTLTRARHIVFRATPDMSQFNINDAKARAEMVLEKIKSGLDFKLAARQFSQDRFTAYLGGDIGYYSPGSMYAPFETAAAALKPGEISGIVRTPVGFHIIKVTERHTDDLLLQLDKHRREKAIQQWRSKAGDAATVERYLGK